MKKLNYLTIVWLFVLIACAPDKNTKNTKQQTDYIINPPDFEELEREKAEWAQRGSKKEENPTLNKEDSIKNYIKELTHYFHLQEKQMKALEYIYAKYHKKEAQAKTQNDTAKLIKLSVEKEKSIEVVLGEHLYERKESFDKQYLKQMPSPTEIEALPVYLKKLAIELSLNKKQISKVQRINQSFNKKIAKNRKNIAATKALKEQNIIDLKSALGDSLYNKKIEYDVEYYQK